MALAIGIMVGAGIAIAPHGDTALTAVAIEREITEFDLTPGAQRSEIFDRYEGEGVPEGKLSLAFRLGFRHNDRTLTDAEVGKSVDRVLRMLAHRFGGELR